MQRVITTYRATAYNVDANTVPSTFKPYATVEYAAAGASETAARKALRNAGHEVPKGTYVTVAEVGTHTYECSLDEFLSVAHIVEA